MENKSEKGIQINLMGKQHQIACPEGEEIALQNAAAYLDDLFFQMKGKSGIRNNEKALLMAALNICHELLQTQNQQQTNELRLANMIAKMQLKLSDN